ncbi:phosphatase PAP2 family protein [Phaeovulum sp.]|uniref:phosphatase PAP2 family protein n=1 Tax=Phaeovulum sp. TaxID=2934796 RepID=UPI00273126F3|nr:phosphatase PAP2 family protein [Phaeovulum sp.]MDP1669515.1 phosphatase PAP2 family protein [Phaeovulum sp.]MDZ4119788.1 phosphatase PAP2 family protein [Phaeovulum sp.]
MATLSGNDTAGGKDALPRIDRARCALVLCAVFALAVATFVGVPHIDLWFSALFYEADRGGFWLQQVPAATLLRRVLMDLTIAMLLISVAGLAGGLLLRRPVVGVPVRVWGFIVSLYALGPGIIVNLILKAHWGRARPSDVTEFGGTAEFTPAGVISDQCAANCSFTSGEGSSAAALAVSAVLPLYYFAPRLPRWAARLWLALALLLPMAGAMQRVVTGRHFLSDTVFSAVIVAAVALVLHWVFSLREGRARG